MVKPCRLTAGLNSELHDHHVYSTDSKSLIGVNVSCLCPGIGCCTAKAAEPVHHHVLLLIIIHIKCHCFCVICASQFFQNLQIVSKLNFIGCVCACSPRSEKVKVIAVCSEVQRWSDLS